VALDASVYAARRAARAHPRATSVVADAWGRLPLLDGSVAVLLVVFAPRAGAEIARVLAPGGLLVVVTPAARHLGELAEPLGLLAVDPRKEERLEATLAPELERQDERELEWAMELDRPAAGSLAAMGPSARHGDPPGVDALPDTIRVTAAVTVSRWRVPR
jgi:23S rRNA (guanine745-N1)-methyltransferase